MIYLTYIVIFFSLVLFQTTIIPAFFESFKIYDLLLIFIIFFGFFKSITESLPTILFLGIFMDCISGGVFGIHLTVYFWLYMVVAVIIQYLHVDSRFLLIVAIIVAVLWENAIILMTMAIENFEEVFSLAPFKIVANQILWAVITGPIIFYLIKTFHDIIENWMKKIFDPKIQKSDF